MLQAAVGPQSGEGGARGGELGDHRGLRVREFGVLAGGHGADLPVPGEGGRHRGEHHLGTVPPDAHRAGRAGAAHSTINLSLRQMHSDEYSRPCPLPCSHRQACLLPLQNGMPPPTGTPVLQSWGRNPLSHHPMLSGALVGMQLWGLGSSSRHATVQAAWQGSALRCPHWLLRAWTTSRSTRACCCATSR